MENVDGVQREIHNLFKILKGREDYKDIMGDWRAIVEGGDLIPTTNECKNLLHSTVIRIDEEETKQKNKDGVKISRKRKTVVKKQNNPWRKYFNVRKIIAKTNDIEDGPSTMTVETEAVIKLTY